MPLIHTDRTRQESALQECPRASYYEFYGGPTGFGFQRNGARLYAETGIAYHEIVAKILQSVQLSGLTPGKINLGLASKARVQIRKFIAPVLQAYRNLVAKEGWGEAESLEESTDAQENWFEEQCCLVEGMVWGFVRVVLPKFLQEFHLISVEREEGVVLGCTCELAGEKSTNYVAHEALDCNGVWQASRPDITMQRLDDLQLGVHDWKTMKYINDYEVNKYKNSTQMAVGTVGVEKRLGVPVTHYYIHAIQRGDRRPGYVPKEGGGKGTFTGPKQQQSDFCYVTFRASNPPVIKHESVTTEGKWYQKQAVWKIEFEEKPEGISNVEWVVEQLPLEELSANYFRIGPYERQTFMIKSHLTQVLHETVRNNQRLHSIYEKVQAGKPLREALDEEVPCSWNCRKWGYDCTYLPICDGSIQVENVMASGEYQARVPHHLYELRVYQDTMGLPLSPLPEYQSDGEVLTKKPSETAAADVVAFPVRGYKEKIEEEQKELDKFKVNKPRLVRAAKPLIKRKE